MDNSPTIAWAKDEEGRYVYLNRAYEQHFDVRLTEWYGKTDAELWPPEIAAEFRKNDSAVLAAEHPMQLSERDGSDRHWIITKFPFRDTAGRRHVGGIGLDITSHKLADDEVAQARRLAEQRAVDLEAVLHAVPAVVWLAHDSECRSISGNRTANEWLRVPDGAESSLTAAADQRPLHFRVLKDGRELLGSELPVQLAATGVEVRDFECQLEFDDGSTRHAFGNATPLWDEHGKPRGSVAAFVDITARKTAEAALRESEERSRLLVEQAADGIYLTDHQGRYLDANPAGIKMLGYTLAELRALAVTDVVVPEEAPGMANYMSQLAEGSVLSSEWCFRRNDGSTFIGEVVGRRLPDGRLLGILRDVSERKAVSEALTRAKEAADHANSAKSTFLATISHEIRTPLHVIIGLAQLMQRDESDPLQVRQRLAQLRDTSEHLLQLLNDVLDISKIEADRLQLDLSDFCLGSVVDQVSGIVEPQAYSKGLKFACDISLDARHLPLRGDALRLGQVLVNLCNNAVKFTAEGGVTLSVTCLSRDQETARFQFLVKDTGIGIAPEDQIHLFEPFVQADGNTTRRYGGTGLGLAISHRIVRMMGGGIRLRSSIGTGSTFSFELSFPMGSPVAEHELRQENIAGHYLLLVEDHPLSQEIIFEMLSDLGCEVDVASDGTEAVACAEARGYDLILMDMQMPKMDGLAATRVIRALPGHQDTPIIALTANAYAEDRQACFEAGMNGHIAKPVTPRKLARQIGPWMPALRNAAPMEGDRELPDAMNANAGLQVPQAWRKSEQALGEYRGLLQRFVDMHGSDMQRLREHLAVGGRDDAYGIAHKLKGIAGLVGATEVVVSANAIVDGLRADVGFAVIDALATKCAADLKDLGESLDKWPESAELTWGT